MASEQNTPNEAALRNEIAKLRVELALYKFVLLLPLVLLVRCVAGPRLTDAIGELKGEAVNRIEDLKDFRYGRFLSDVMTSSPGKILNVVEAYLLWRIRRGLLIILLASFPAILLFQQNSLIRSQNELITEQSDIFQRQTDLLQVQSADVFVERSLADLQVVRRVDYAQIERIAEAIERLEDTRRGDHINTLRQMITTGWQRAMELRDLYRSFEDQGKDSFLGASGLVSQYSYLSAVLLANSLNVNDEIDAHWAMIFDLDLSNSDLTRADLGNVCLHKATLTMPVEGAVVQPVIWENLSENCNVTPK